MLIKGGIITAIDSSKDRIHQLGLKVKAVSHLGKTEEEKKFFFFRFAASNTLLLLEILRPLLGEVLLLFCRELSSEALLLSVESYLFYSVADPVYETSSLGIPLTSTTLIAVGVTCST